MGEKNDSNAQDHGAASENSGKELAIVGIGASAGGLEALREVFQAYAGMPGMAFVVVQHLDPDHESLMAQLLERYTEMTVTQAQGGETIEANHIYVIPPGHGLAVQDGVLALTEFRDPRGLRRPIDEFFESLAQDRGRRSACVILSGTGRDGSRGLRAIKENGGLAIVQDPDSARYDGMPLSAISTSLVDMVVKPGQVIECLRNFFERADAIELGEDHGELASQIDGICAVLQEVTGHDFSGYKRSTLSRRIARRMQVVGLETMVDYLARLEGDIGECEALFRDLLINVTRFFRDEDEFERLAEEVIDPLIKNASENREIRVWVPGCSSGEEAYTIALLMAESMRKHNKRPYVQIFATDIDDKMLDIARQGAYPLAALRDIPPQMHEYLDIGPDHFRIKTRIRDMVRFSLHNVVRDPPFSKLDLVSCRNVLIYFDEDLQRVVIPTLHFALADGGKLFLGSSETIGRFDDLFETTDQRSRLYDRKAAVGRYALRLTQQRRRMDPVVRPVERQPATSTSAHFSALERIAERYAPVSILVDQEGLLLDRWGATGRYLDFPDRFDQNIHAVRQAKPGLREVIGPLLREVANEKSRKIARDIDVMTDFGPQKIDLMCEPINGGAYLVVFKAVGPIESQSEEDFQDYIRGEGELQYLQDELQSARFRLRSTVEELETANEELKSSNEEMMSMNEELQSTNEELTTVNDELKAKVDQLTVANADLKNFFDSTQVAVVVVDGDLAIRSYTDEATAIMRVDDRKVGINIREIPHDFEDDRLIEHARRSAKEGLTSEFRAQTVNEDATYMIRCLPYRLLDGTVDGATLVFTEITKALSLEQELDEERARLRMALEVAKIGVWEYDPSSGRTELDDTERELFGIDEVAEGEFMEPILALLPGEDRDRVNSALRRAMDGEHTFDEVFRLPMKDGSERWLHGLARRISVGDKKKFVGVTYDVTAERELLEQRELMIREMNHRVKNLFAVISALIAMSVRNAKDVKEFANDLRDRIEALGRAHSLTTDPGDSRFTLRKIFETIVQPAANGQSVELNGNETEIAPRSVTPLALICHEWTTNSAKYGALSVPDGNISISWETKGDRVAIDWEESGKSSEGDGVEAFGSQLITATSRQLGGSASGAATDDGYSRRLEFKFR